MAKGWYIVQTFTGHEHKVEKYMRIYMEDGTLGSAVTNIKVPTEEVVEVRNGVKRTVNKTFLPGYILVEMDLSDGGWKIPCGQIRKIQGVSGFVGTPRSAKPQPISTDEARVLLQKMGTIKAERRMHSKQEFHIGEQVQISEGPFESFKGVVEVVNQEKSKLRVTVGIFGRSTPVEVGFAQVIRV